MEAQLLGIREKNEVLIRIARRAGKVRFSTVRRVHVVAWKGTRVGSLQEHVKVVQRQLTCMTPLRHLRVAMSTANHSYRWSLIVSVMWVGMDSTGNLAGVSGRPRVAPFLHL